MNRINTLTAIAVSALTLLQACTDEQLSTATIVTTKTKVVASLTQDWDCPVATRAARNSGMPASDALRGNTCLQAENNHVITATGMIGEAPVYIYATEVEGISAAALPIALPSQPIPTSNSQPRDPSSSQPLTRGMLYGNASNRFHDTFCAYSSIIPTAARLISPDAMTANPEEATWYLDKPINWPDDEAYTFYAIAPFNHYTGVSAVTPVLSYQNPDETLHQEDIMAAVTTGRSSDSEIRFPFKHILAAIKLKIGDKGLANPHDNTKITNVTISGIYKKGTYNIATDQWTIDTDVKGLVKQADTWEGFSLAGKSNGANLMISSDIVGTTFLVVPQVIPEGALLTVTIEEDGVSNDITAQLSGQWQQGHTITYNITSTNDYPGYILEVEAATPLTFDFTGHPTDGSEFIVRSYKNDIDKTPVAWSIDGFANGTDGWSTTNTTFAQHFKVNDIDNRTGGSGGQSGETVRIPTVNAQAKRVLHEDYRRQNELSQRSEYTERFDLSLYMADNTTLWPHGACSANSYIVRQAGNYKIPVVAGNAIVNGNINSYSGPGYRVFVNYKDQTMSNIDNLLLKTATKAEILWQDAQGLINVETAIRTNEASFDGQTVNYLYFDVPKAGIKQGNAVVVVKDNSGIIVWSFHIYVTNTDWTQTISCQGQDTNPVYNFAPEVLGYVEHTYKHLIYDARYLRLRITQNTSGLTAQVGVNQTEAEVKERLPFAVHFQFRRKDAFPGIEPYYSSTTVVGKYAQMTVGNAIKNPMHMTMGDSRSDWHQQSGVSGISWPNVTNFWSAANMNDADNSLTPYNDDPVIKTIYDPSPAGFHVPPSNAFLFTTKKSKSSTVIDYRSDNYYLVQTLLSDTENWNALTDATHDYNYTNGYFFYTKSNPTATTPIIYFPLCGRRYAGDAKLSGLNHLVSSAKGKGGYLWCATPYHKGVNTGSNPSKRPATGCLFSMFGNQVYSRANGDVNKQTNDYNYRTGGLCILPVIDTEANIY